MQAARLIVIGLWLVVVAAGVAVALLSPNGTTAARPDGGSLTPTPVPTDFPLACEFGSGVGTIIGTPGSDFLIGTLQDDVIASLEGGDVAFGLPGDDVICNGSHLVVGGDDLFVGGRGDDTLLGGFGDDILFGGPGRDYLNGGPGFATGFDICIGGPGEDTFSECEVIID